MSTVPATRRWLDRATAWSPVFLLGGLAVLTWWLDAQIQPAAPPRDGSARHDPDLFIEDFRAVNLDAEGRPLQIVSGAAARHFPDNQMTEITKPQLATTQSGKPALRVSADRGELTGDRKNAYFTGNVVATSESGIGKPGQAASGPVTLKTEYLHVIPDANVVRTDKAVTISEPRGIISSVGLELDNTAKTLKLKSAVQGTMQPQAIPK